MSETTKPIPMMSHLLPLRPGVNASVVIPRDLTAKDAAKLKEFIDALVVPWEPKP